jgi:hypothetical protein
LVDRDRFVVSDAAWEKIASLLPGKASDRGVTAKDNRLWLLLGSGVVKDPSRHQRGDEGAE